MPKDLADIGKDRRRVRIKCDVMSNAVAYAGARQIRMSRELKEAGSLYVYARNFTHEGAC